MVAAEATTRTVAPKVETIWSPAVAEATVPVQAYLGCV
jgi:hypothetical protein